MRLGCCISGGDQLAVLERAGAEYCELPVARALMDGDDAFEQLAARLGGSPVSGRACNVFLPGGLKKDFPAEAPLGVEHMRVAARHAGWSGANWGG